MKFNYNPVEPIRITSRFGKRNTGIDRASTNHKGIDLGRNLNKVETPLVLTNEAKLITNAWNDYRGWYVIFQIDDTYKILYQHMKAKCTLKKGQTYPPGTIVGIMGNSSNKKKLNIATHLHFEVHKNDIPINPEPFFDNLEVYEMIDTMNVLLNGKQVKVTRIYKNGTNFIKLRDFDDVLGLCSVDYDSAKKMPVIKSK